LFRELMYNFIYFLYNTYIIYSYPLLILNNIPISLNCQQKSSDFNDNPVF